MLVFSYYWVIQWYTYMVFLYVVPHVVPLFNLSSLSSCHLNIPQVPAYSLCIQIYPRASVTCLPNMWVGRVFSYTLNYSTEPIHLFCHTLVEAIGVSLVRMPARLSLPGMVAIASLLGCTC